MIKYIKQTWHYIVQDPVVSIVSIIGTALSIFLIMVVVMTIQVKVVPFSPESNRNRLLHANRCNLINMKNNGESSGSWSEWAAKELFKELKSPEAVTLYSLSWESKIISIPSFTGVPIQAKYMGTDAVFWKVFDFKFISGKPYDEAMFKSAMNVVVISRTIAKRFFAGTDPVGKEVLLGCKPYKVVGVVKEVSSLATSAFADLWIPYTVLNIEEGWGPGNLGGNFNVAILARSNSDFKTIHSEADRRLAIMNKKMAKDSVRLESYGRPYTQEEFAFGPKFSNEKVNLKPYKMKVAAILFVLLLIPAINLSSMTQSRLQRRVSEIGLRRAFGCTKGEIIRNIIAENLAISIVAGVIGLFFSYLYIFLMANILFGDFFNEFEGTLQLSEILHLSTFIYALLFCFILNLVSSIVPALRASRVSIVCAMGGNNR